MFSVVIPKPSSLNPRTRLAAVFIPAFLIGVTLDPVALTVLTLTAFGLALAAGVTRGDLRRAVVPLSIFCGITLIMHLLFTRTDASAEISLGFIALNGAALTIGLLYCWRIALFFVVALAFARWITQEEFAESVWRMLTPLGRIGIPVQGIGMALTIAIRFIPQIFAEHRRIGMAQRARGANPGGSRLNRVRQFVPLLVPTIASALRRVNTTADALTVRAWGVTPTRTFFRQSSFKMRDIGVLAAVLAIIVVIAVLP